MDSLFYCNNISWNRNGHLHLHHPLPLEQRAFTDMIF